MVKPHRYKCAYDKFYSKIPEYKILKEFRVNGVFTEYPKRKIQDSKIEK